MNKKKSNFEHVADGVALALEKEHKRFVKDLGAAIDFIEAESGKSGRAEIMEYLVRLQWKYEKFKSKV